jgi:hypothetical protein
MTYRHDVLAALADHHSVFPKPCTPPKMVKEFIDRLYRYELRRLRERLVRRDIPKKEYADAVIELRKRYPLISMPWREWTVRERDAVNSE